MSTYPVTPIVELGSTTIQRVVELEKWDFPPELLFELSPELLEEARREFDWRSVDPQTGKLILSAHTWVIRAQGRTILVDTCNGNHKQRPVFGNVHLLNEPYLERLAAAGVRPDEVDVVMCTHLHPDHIGWNTQLVDGTWVPTFPNAAYLMSPVDFADMTDWYDHGERRFELDHDLARSWEDSVLPVIEHGLAQFVDPDHVIVDELAHGVRLEAMPGHTRGHAGVLIEGGGRTAVATGDAFHHLLQLNHPEIGNLADRDPEQAQATRRGLFERFADTDTIVLPGHFPAPSAGRIVSRGDRLEFRFLGQD
ncbi:unannotated protein [freshwater metagenome]|uniref:Unannotated protein n=1 Tax=freshwater metagenome TaxID=449393 RepID=A0A6J7IEA5_9ZZZZ